MDEFDGAVEYMELHDEFYESHNVPPIKTDPCGVIIFNVDNKSSCDIVDIETSISRKFNEIGFKNFLSGTEATRLGSL